MKKIIDWYTSTSWHKWWMEYVWKPSWTKLTSWFLGLPSGIVAVGQFVSDFMQDNTIQSYLTQFDIPNWVPSTMTLIALVYYLAHGRK